MFFKNSNKKKSEPELVLSQMNKGFQSLEQLITAENAQKDELNQNFHKLQTVMQKHDMAIEDLLETWEEKQSDEKEIKERFREYKQNEQHLLELFEAYQEQFWNLKRFADTKDEMWSKQISLMEKNMEHYRLLCGINIIGESGTEVDYDLHEVIEVVNTTDAAKDKQVAEVYCYGYLYKGKIKKKAKVSAYHVIDNG